MRHLRRFILLVVVVLFLSAAALVTTETGRNLLSDAKDKLSSLNLLAPENQSRVQISAKLELRDFDVNYPTKELSVDFNKTSQHITINSENLDLSELNSGTLVLANWAGNLKASSEGGISLDGKASRLAVNSVAVLPEKESLAISTKELSFSLAKLNDISLDKFSYTSTGTVSINNGQVNANLQDETLEIRGFEGSFEVTPDTLTINGTAIDVNIDGKAISASIA